MEFYTTENLSMYNEKKTKYFKNCSIDKRGKAEKGRRGYTTHLEMKSKNLLAY